uniref:Transposase n=1 Tax=Bursaphelenchus xylophilus TaxID=6326 RepID=A0A1I7RY48_BURXY
MLAVVKKNSVMTQTFHSKCFKSQATRSMGKKLRAWTLSPPWTTSHQMARPLQESCWTITDGNPPHSSVEYIHGTFPQQQNNSKERKYVKAITIG